MALDTFEDIVKYAAEREAESVDFYTELAKNENYSAGRKTFLAFVEEEMKHRVSFSGIDEKQVADFQPEDIPNLKRSDYMTPIEYTTTMSYRDVLKVAMKREEQAYQFYEECAAGCEGPNKNLFLMLAQEEAKHKAKLETMYDDLMASKGD